MSLYIPGARLHDLPNTPLDPEKHQRIVPPDNAGSYLRQQDKFDDGARNASDIVNRQEDTDHQSPIPSPFRRLAVAPETPSPAKHWHVMRPPAPAAKKKHDITLTIGFFFDGTGNNAVNMDNMLESCSSENFLSDTEAHSLLTRCGEQQMGVSGMEATSYTGYYTNIHWLRTLYKVEFSAKSQNIQRAIYIQGIGTKAGKPDSVIGQALGILNTGIMAKTDEAVAQITQAIHSATANLGSHIIVKAIQFDIFGFSRGAAAARHFANRIANEDTAIIHAIRAGLGKIDYHGAPSGKTRFIGIFDTVTAIVTPTNGLNPHHADTGNVDLSLSPGVADKVFHITAQHECRFNFALNSVHPHWPELTLPGAHSDIGGGYLPQEREDLYLTHPYLYLIRKDQQTKEIAVYHQVKEELNTLTTFPTLAPILRTQPDHIRIETWFDYLHPEDRRLAALSLRHRVVKNDWSKVVLRVMLEAAEEAGVLFEPIRDTHPELQLPPELIPLCDQALAQGKAVRSGQTATGFTSEEIDRIAQNYIHCSAHWGTVEIDANGTVKGNHVILDAIGFPHRPDHQWQRTVYRMRGQKHKTPTDRSLVVAADS